MLSGTLTADAGGVTPQQLDHLHSAAMLAGVPIPAVARWHSFDVVTNGVRLRVLQWEPGDGPPLVFVHGGSLTAHTWDIVCAALSNRYSCIAVDMRGHGDSEWSPGVDYAVSTLAEDLACLIHDYLDVPPVLIGMSLGGLASLDVARRKLAALAGLVIVDVGPDMHLGPAREIIDFTQLESELDRVEDFVERARTFNSRRRPEILRRSLLYNLRQTSSGKWTWKWDPRRLRGVDLDRLRDEQARLWTGLEAIRTRTLVVRGGRSRIFSATDQAALVEAIPGARAALVPNAGHTVQGDDPQGLLRVLEPFLASTTTSDTSK